MNIIEAHFYGIFLCVPRMCGKTYDLFILLSAYSQPVQGEASKW